MKEIIAFLILISLLFAWYYCQRRESFINQPRLVTLHYASWCPHCQTMFPIWQRLKESARGINFKENDEQSHPTPNITSYPTILMLDEHGYAHKYSGGPNFDKLYTWTMAPLLP